MCFYEINLFDTFDFLKILIYKGAFSWLGFLVKKELV